MRDEGRRASLAPTCVVDVPMADGARVRAFAYAPEGVSDEPGTPFAVSFRPAPVVVLHGNGEDHGRMLEVVGQLARERSVIAIDSRGHGESARGGESLSYELMAADVLEVMSRLGVTQAHVLGFSDGGIVGLLLARAVPWRVLSLTCLGANLSPEGLSRASRIGMQVALAGLEPIERVGAVLHGAARPVPAAGESLGFGQHGESVGVEDGEDGSAARCVDDACTSSHDAPGSEPFFCEAAGEPERYSEAELLRLMLEQPHIDPASLGVVRCPVCVMAGERDLIRPEETRRIAEAIPGSRLVIVPGAGHDLPQEAPGRVVEEARLTMEAGERPVRDLPLVVWYGNEPQVSDGGADVAARPATAADEPAVLALYERLLDSCEVGGRETCGWRRGFWPLPDDVSRRLRAGTTWVAVRRGSDGAPGATPFGAAPLGATPVPGAGPMSGAGEAGAAPVPGAEEAGRILGAMSLDDDFGLPGIEPGWEPLGADEALTCHLLVTDPSARGRGVARALLGAYAREALRLGCRALRINTSPQSLSNRLYHELGFTLHRPVWFPYEGLPLSGWTNVYELRLDGKGASGGPVNYRGGGASDGPAKFGGRDASGDSVKFVGHNGSGRADPRRAGSDACGEIGGAS